MERPLNAQWERWEEVDRIFAEALERPRPQRRRFVARVCGDDSDLYHELLTLLDAAGRAEQVLAGPGPSLLRAAFSDLGEAEPDGAALRPGEEVGHYRVVEEIGRGGMATVYLAERADGAFERQVAVKVLRRGMDTEEVVRRFRVERQILSSLAHPNIARLLDGGATEDGRPYLVMERVEGLPITEWCDHEKCSLKQRLRLFADVARAVHHAHTKLVVHRDLKPSNIFVTPAGRVTLLDFGIAKILDPEQVPGGEPGTGIGFRPLTPEYASPEQLRGGPITTASDVYQLGLLLHRLLTGARPHDVRGSAEQQRTATSLTPKPPSELAREASAEVAAVRRLTADRLCRRLRGDLDTIVLTALRVEPARRYGSVLEMGEDVRRYLEGRPISARRDSRLYRLKKLMTRHRWLAPTAAAAILASGLYIFTLVRHGLELEAERNAAQRQAERAERVRDILVDVFRSADPWWRADPELPVEFTMPEALAIEADRIRSDLADEPQLRADLFAAIGGVYVNLGLPAKARPLLEDALNTRLAFDGPNSGSSAAVMRQLGKVHALQGDVDSAAVLLRTSLDYARRLRDPRDTVVIGTLVDLAWVQKGRGRFDEAEQLLMDAIRRAETSNNQPTEVMARAYSMLSIVYPNQDRLEEARLAAERSLALLRAEHRENDPRLAAAMRTLANALALAGHSDEAIPEYRSAIEMYTHSLGADHRETLNAREGLALALNRIAHWKDRVGPAEEAERILRQVLARRIALFGEEDVSVAQSRQRLAVVLYGKGQFDEAERLTVLAARVPQHNLTTYPLMTRCGIQLARSDYERAEATCRETIRIMSATLPREHYGRALAQCRLGRALAGQKRYQEAEAILAQATPILENVPRQLAWEYTRECLEAVASVYETLGRKDEAARWRRVLERIPHSVAQVGTR